MCVNLYVGAHRGQRRASDSMELELQICKQSDMSVGTTFGSFARTRTCSYLLSRLSSPST